MFDKYIYEGLHFIMKWSGQINSWAWRRHAKILRTKQSKDIVIALNASGANVAFAEIKTDKGHDSFLVNEPKFLNTIKGFIDSSYEVYSK